MMNITDGEYHGYHAWVNLWLGVSEGTFSFAVDT